MSIFSSSNSSSSDWSPKLSYRCIVFFFPRSCSRWTPSVFGVGRVELERSAVLEVLCAHGHGVWSTVERRGLFAMDIEVGPNMTLCGDCCWWAVGLAGGDCPEYAALPRLPEVDHLQLREYQFSSKFPFTFSHADSDSDELISISCSRSTTARYHARTTSVLPTTHPCTSHFPARQSLPASQGTPQR